jgi:uncharacterized protein (DUF1919 family)
MAKLNRFDANIYDDFLRYVHEAEQYFDQPLHFNLTRRSFSERWQRMPERMRVELAADFRRGFSATISETLAESDRLFAAMKEGNGPAEFAVLLQLLKRFADEPHHPKVAAFLRLLQGPLDEYCPPHAAES